MSDFEKAKDLLYRFRGDSYLCGTDVLSRVGAMVGRVGHRAALVRGTFRRSDDYVRMICESLTRAGVCLCGEIKGARTNAPREDMTRIAQELHKAAPDVIVSFGGGSTIDATKAANVLGVLGGGIDDYFGLGRVTEGLRQADRVLASHVAIQTLAGSAAHLTKYANITDLASSQKKLIVDEAIVPNQAVFDHGVTSDVPADLTADGALDGVSHILEVLYGAVGKPCYETVAEIAQVGLGLILEHLPRAMSEPCDIQAREALSLATDLGGYAIMIGGTNGGHLTSFSLVDILSHGRACAVMNPYYTVLFAPAIEKPLRLVGGLYRRAGLTDTDFETLQGRDLGIAVAEVMLAFAREIGFPTRLADIDGFAPSHIERALTAAKDPQLAMKLQSMPIPLTTEMVDDYMGAVLEAARVGKLEIVRNVPGKGECR